MSENNRRIVYSCPFVPAEWIAAHGLTPSRITPECRQSPALGVGSGICSYAKAFAETAISETDVRAIIVTTLCNQMRRISEVIEERTDTPVFLMQIPSTWESANAHRMYLSEIERLGRFMERLGGESPSKEHLAEVMQEYDNARASIRDVREMISGRAYAETLAAFFKGEGFELPESGNSRLFHGLPIALIGGPMQDERMQIIGIIENLGGRVALNATENGERALPAPFDRRRLQNEPLNILAETYFDIPDVSRRPNSAMYRWLADEIKSREVRGVIMIRHIWCDLWHAEAQRMKEWFGLPFLDLDMGEFGTDSSRIFTRLQAFLETLK